MNACFKLELLMNAGLYIIESPPRWGGGKSKGLEMGKGKEEGKKRKKENLGKIILLAVRNHKTWLVKHNSTQFKH